jgi:hypothetical protein
MKESGELCRRIRSNLALGELLRCPCSQSLFCFELATGQSRRFAFVDVQASVPLTAFVVAEGDDFASAVGDFDGLHCFVSW